MRKEEMIEDFISTLKDEGYKVDIPKFKKEIKERFPGKNKELFCIWRGCCELYGQKNLFIALSKRGITAIYKEKKLPPKNEYIPKNVFIEMSLPFNDR